MLLNSGSSRVFLVTWAKAMEATDSRTREMRIMAKIKLIFLMGLLVFRTQGAILKRIVLVLIAKIAKGAIKRLNWS
jgi:hypothetical protein